MLRSDRGNKARQELPVFSKRLSAPDLENLSPVHKYNKDKKHSKHKEKSWFNTLGKKAFLKMGTLLPKNFSVSNLET